ncbi:MAG: 16S rRNA (guanine(966)-N(2))-methyltransferase RsmD [Chloroflexi bacterium]|nr:16S rRNA (guanine(966)-N(2))-methyltransferase RsmD [Chloroflexota bacterium]
MRVISGKAKGRRLKMVPGDSTRPILDRIKENLFNILGPWVSGTRWLDLFAGTGQVGIEALSRGAEHVLFTEIDRQAIDVINHNLELTGLQAGAEVRREDAFRMLAREPDEGFEVIFIAPPQYKGLWKKALEAIDAQPEWVYPDGLVIVQIDPKEWEEVSLDHLELFDERRYGKTLLLFYERPGG